MKNWQSTKYRNRSGWSYSSDSFRTTILEGGGHIAELTTVSYTHLTLPTSDLV